MAQKFSQSIHLSILSIRGSEYHVMSQGYIYMYDSEEGCNTAKKFLDNARIDYMGYSNQIQIQW